MIKTVDAMAGGRTDQPVLAAADAGVGKFELAFHIADYHAAQNVASEALFVDRFHFADGATYGQMSGDAMQRNAVLIPRTTRIGVLLDSCGSAA